MAREGAVLARHMLVRRFARPALVRETSRATGVWGIVVALCITLLRGWRWVKTVVLRFKSKTPTVGERVLEVCVGVQGVGGCV